MNWPLWLPSWRLRGRDGTGAAKPKKVHRLETQLFRMHRKYPHFESNQQMAGKPGRSGGARKNAGGRRAGAGRPLGSRNRPHLIADLPVTDSPAVWLLALMNRPDVRLRMRMHAAKTLLPYLHARPGLSAEFC